MGSAPSLGRLRLAAPVLMMVDREVGSTFRTDVAMMVVMLSLRLPKVIFSRGRELLAWRARRRFGLRRDDRERCRRMQRQAVAFLDRRFVEIVVDRRPRRIKTRRGKLHVPRPERPTIPPPPQRGFSSSSSPCHTLRYSTSANPKQDLTDGAITYVIEKPGDIAGAADSTAPH